MNHQYHYNLTGAKRKALVEAISTILEITAAYQKAPTFAYKIGVYTVDKTGALLFPEDTDPKEVQKLLTKLQDQGYQPEEPIEFSSPQVAEESHTLTIELPKGDLTATALDNLKKTIKSKATLLKQAIGTECLEIEETEDTMKFPWFTLHGVDGEADAYSRLITALIEMAKRQKRVTAKEKPVENAKFDMRLFLVRLGFIGDEYKAARKILTQNLTGNSAWKSGQPPENRAEPAFTPPETSAVATAMEPTEVEDYQEKGGAHYDKP